MRLDQVLTLTEGLALAQELANPRWRGPIEVRGVHQERGGSIWQFAFALDEASCSWSMQSEGGFEQWFEDGVLHGVDAPVEFSFERSLPSAISMAVPECMRWWGRERESFAPVLVQRIGEHSLLVTFEHVEDPAFRTTLVVDERDWIARRRIDFGEITVITEVRRVVRWAKLPRPSFSPLTGPIATVY
ncbi:hypothetical protein IFT90_15525 [Frigoribacterium sp. CFBP 8766]|uniref:hypothetical protein n=1 Tax=Frigoribacterium sp. CFBP 8766 TaxID=2775273 RepID=UPI0017858675|nr:hypothetical protein [Frigoribacterium sp. CFBP 8766]MBD8585965.1 hypothetical protein [Frigoribacterium sp. CFBP 8766]